jgi:hypothetical protein
MLVTILTGVGAGVALLTWLHEQRQQVLNARFENIKKRLSYIERKLEELPINFVLKSDLNDELNDIRTWLRSINDKLDQLILNRR